MLELNEEIDDEIDVDESTDFYSAKIIVFDIIKNINDPEHPLTLEKLNVVRTELISIDAIDN